MRVRVVWVDDDDEGPGMIIVLATKNKWFDLSMNRIIGNQHQNINLKLTSLECINVGVLFTFIILLCDC